VGRAASRGEGSWACVGRADKKKTISPGSTIQFGAKADQWLTPASEGSVEYEVPGTKGAVVTVSWCNPFGFLRSESASFTGVLAVVKGKSVRRTHAKGYLLEAKCTVGAVEGSVSTPPPIPDRDHRRGSTSPGVAKSSTSNSAGASAWNSRLVGCQRAVFVTILNNTDATLLLESHGTGVGTAWALQPTPIIGPQQRCTVVAYTRGLGGTSGTLVWTVGESDRRLLIIWENPQHGPNVKQAQVPENFVATMKMAERTNSGLVVVLTRKSGPADPLISDEVDDMEWTAAVNASPPKAQWGGFDDSQALRVFSQACYLLPPPLASGDPQRRAQLLAEALRDAPYTVICLQEVFWANAQEALRKALQPQFPHIIDKSGKEAYGVGVTAGLFFASKSPIEWSQFFPFEMGIGSDSFASKGVLLVKIKQNNTYIAMTDMQSDPDGSIPWKLHGNSKARAVQVRLSQAQMIARLVSQTISEREKHPETCGLLIAGVLHVGAERRVRLEQEQWANSTLIPHLADLLNAGRIAAVFASELLEELRSRGFQSRFLGQLRAATADRRSRSLLLVIMIARVLQQELWLAMREEVFASKADEQRKYVELCLLYFEAIAGLDKRKVLSSSAPQLVTPVAPGTPPPVAPLSNDALSSLSSSNPENGGGDGGRAVLKLLRGGIWERDLVKLIQHAFGAHALNEEQETHAPFLRAEIMWFQLLRYQQELLGVRLSAAVEVELLRNGPRALEYPDDVDSASMDVLKIYEDLDADQKLQIERTEEFTQVLSVLGDPHDIFRELNPKEFGGDGTILLPQSRDETRQHHLLALDHLPDQRRTPLLKLTAMSCTRPLLTGDSGAMTDLLSFVPGVEAVLKPVAEGGFELV
jgi:hypothetical protein